MISEETTLEALVLKFGNLQFNFHENELLYLSIIHNFKFTL